MIFGLIEWKEKAVLPVARISNQAGFKAPPPMDNPPWSSAGAKPTPTPAPVAAPSNDAALNK